IGVFDLEKAKLMAEVLSNSGSEKVVTLFGAEGLDEVSCAGTTIIFEAGNGGAVKRTEISPETFGFSRHPLESLQGSDAAANAGIVTEILNGAKGPKRDAVLMNAAVGFYAGGRCHSIAEGLSLGEAALDSGEAMQALEILKRVSHS